jgi:NAD(P)H-dependent FMN reductase
VTDADPAPHPTDEPTATRPFRVLAFSGSLRAASSNTGLVHLATRSLREQGGDEVEIEVVDWIDQIPYYNEDLEADQLPVVTRWRSTLGAADALVIGMPEYNFGPPAVAKNAIDWATRPYGSAALSGKVIALLTSAGKGGGTNVQQALVPILGYLGNTVVEQPPVTIALGFQRIAADGTTEDPEIVRLVTEKMANLLAALRAR